MAASVVGREDHVEELEKLIEERIGKRVEVEVRHVEEGDILRYIHRYMTKESI